MYVYICLYEYIHNIVICICMYRYERIHAYIHTYIYTHNYDHARMHIYVCMYVCVYVCMYVFMDICCTPRFMHVYT